MDIGAQQIQAIRLEDGEAEYMGDGCWMLQRLEEAQRDRRWHSFCLPEEDRQALLALPDAADILSVTLEDGEGHYMGDGDFVLVRQEAMGSRVVRHCIAVSVGDLERLGSAEGDSLGMLMAA